MKVSNDLISRSALMRSLRNNVLVDVAPNLEQAIAEQPIAYDVDKVVERVREFHGICNKCLNNKNSIATCSTFCDIGKELEVIKSGGIE